MEESQKYKEGKFILEKGKIMKVSQPFQLFVGLDADVWCQ